jgi:hypothetical protein
MTSPFIERLARAAFLADYEWRMKNAFGDEASDSADFEPSAAFDLIAGLKERWIAATIGLLIAAMEPSEEMLATAAQEHVGVERTREGEGRCVTPSIVWQAMLTKALE